LLSSQLEFVLVVG